MDTTTAPWTPLTSLSPTITIKKSPWGAIVVNAEAMTDIGDGWYEYVFSDYTASQDYTYACNPNHSRCYIESGVTDNLAQLISEVRGWGGGSINIQGIQTTIRNTWERVIEEVKKQHDETRGVIESANNDTKSHIDIANWELSSKIESIEIPETDLSDINKSLGVVKAQLTKAVSAKDKEIEQVKKEYEGKLKEKEDEIEDLEETYKELEDNTGKEIEEKVSEKQQLIDELEETAQELMDEYEKENKNAKDIVIEQIKQSL